MALFSTLGAAGSAALISGTASVATSVLSAREARRQAALQERLIRYQEYFLEDDKRRNEKYRPAVDAALDELIAEPKVTAKTETMIARAHAVIEADIARARRQLRECTSVYCAPVTCSQLAQLQVQAAIGKADIAVSTMRQEEARVRTLNEKRRSEIINVVGNATRGAFQDSTKSIALLLDYYGKQREQAQRAFSGSLKELGYQANRLFNPQSAPQATAPTATWGTPDVDRRTSEILRELAQGRFEPASPPMNPLDDGGWATYGTSEGE